MSIGRKLKKGVCIDTNIDCQNCDSWERVCVWNGECDNLEEQTNEEWFCGLSTEEKAEWLSNRDEFIYDCGQRSITPKIMDKDEWDVWLKEVHKDG